MNSAEKTVYLRTKAQELRKVAQRCAPEVRFDLLGVAIGLDELAAEMEKHAVIVGHSGRHALSTGTSSS